MTHWREPHSWKRGLDAAWRHVEYIPPEPTIRDWTIFWLVIVLAMAVAAIGWATS